MNYDFVILIAILLSLPLQALIVTLIKPNTHLHKANPFNFGSYIFTLSLPLVVLLAAIIYDPKYLLFYLIFALLGETMEFLYGYIYHRALGKRSWAYRQFDLHGYTSLTSLPLWGFSGILVWSLIKLSPLPL